MLQDRWLSGDTAGQIFDDTPGQRADDTGQMAVG